MLYTPVLANKKDCLLRILRGCKRSNINNIIGNTVPFKNVHAYNVFLVVGCLSEQSSPGILLVDAITKIDTTFLSDDHLFIYFSFSVLAVGFARSSVNHLNFLSVVFRRSSLQLAGRPTLHLPRSPLKNLFSSNIKRNCAKRLKHCWFSDFIFILAICLQKTDIVGLIHIKLTPRGMCSRNNIPTCRRRVPRASRSHALPFLAHVAIGIFCKRDKIPIEVEISY